MKLVCFDFHSAAYGNTFCNNIYYSLPTYKVICVFPFPVTGDTKFLDCRAPTLLVFVTPSFPKTVDARIYIELNCYKIFFLYLI